LNSTDNIVQLNSRIDELKDYLNRIENRIDLIYSDMGHLRENMATREDINRLRDNVATSTEVDRLWKLNQIYVGAIITLLASLLASLIYYFFLK